MHADLNDLVNWVNYILLLMLLIFIQTAKSYNIQRMTMSNYYEHQKTVKVLFVNAPNSDILYLFWMHAGSIYDK